MTLLLSPFVLSLSKGNGRRSYFDTLSTSGLEVCS